MILVIDNYDSFTFNVVQAIQMATEEKISAVRNDEFTMEEIIAMKPSKLIVSPGPGSPSAAGISEDAIKYFAGKIPVLGICLGHQAIGEAFGAKITGAKFIKHGAVEEMNLDGRGIFRSIGKSCKFTRYHSLVIDEKSLPPEFEVTARSKDGDIMGIRHKEFILEGIQFHPESVASDCCQKLIKAFLNYHRDNLDVSFYLNTLIAKNDLTEEQAYSFMENVADGTMDERNMAAILVAMAAKQPVTSEMTGCAKALMNVKTPFPFERPGLAEIVGTGGDGKGSFNISSMAALVAASCGQKVAKHGNRAVSSKSGAADFFENLGVNIMASPEKTAELLEKTGFGFLMAPVYHSAMRFAAPVRKVLGIKTIFNIMGPLLNPARAEYEVLGVYSRDLMQDYARTAKALGAKHVMVVCSRDGYDEISPVEITDVYEIDEGGNERQYEIDPKKMGISGCSEDELMGGNGADNARLAMDVLNGNGRKTIRCAVGLNAAAILYLSGKASSIEEGYGKAVGAIDDGSALRKVREIQKVSGELASA